MFYHAAPDPGRLVWDRLPMTLGFTGLLAAVIAERIGVRLARWLLVPLLALGVASVLTWYSSEVQGASDIRLYVLVQGGSLALVALLLVLYPARYTGGSYFAAGLALYAVAKGVELADDSIFALGQLVSGHTLKHLLAAAAIGCLVGMVRARTPVDAGSGAR